jgi:putative two-component system response regulator
MTVAANTVLVVDDCRINLLLVKHILSKVGIKADTAGCGLEGLSLSRLKEYPLILLDIMLPDIDGFEVYRRIREEEKAWHPKIVFLTAMGESYPENRASEVGADGVYFKPLVPSQILDLARKSCESHPAAGVSSPPTPQAAVEPGGAATGQAAMTSAASAPQVPHVPQQGT